MFKYYTLNWIIQKIRHSEMITTKEFFSYIVSNFYEGNQAAASDDLGIKKQSLSTYMLGKSEAKYDTVLKVYSKYKDQLNAEWVLGQSDVPEKVTENEELEMLRAKVGEMKADLLAFGTLLKKYRG